MMRISITAILLVALGLRALGASGAAPPKEGIHRSNEGFFWIFSCLPNPPATGRCGPVSAVDQTTNTDFRNFLVRLIGQNIEAHLNNGQYQEQTEYGVETINLIAAHRLTFNATGTDHALLVFHERWTGLRPRNEWVAQVWELSAQQWRVMQEFHVELQSGHHCDSTTPFDAAQQTLTLSFMEAERPFVYAWNGRRFEHYLASTP